MSDKYDFGNLSPIEFEALAVDLVSETTGLLFESFCAGSDEGMDGRHSTATSNIILQAKHYKNSTWADLKKSARNEKSNIQSLNPSKYYFVTTQNLNSARKKEIKKILNHKSVETRNIWGRTEINARLQEHSNVEKRHIKLWLTSAAVLARVLNNNIAVFTEATQDEIERILKVFVVNPSVRHAAKILDTEHCLIISGPPGVGKTTLAQFLATEYCENGWELVAISSIDDGLAAFNSEQKQIYVFDDFLGKIKLDRASLAKDEYRISRFMKMVGKRENKRFILTTRAYIFQAAKESSEALDEPHIDLSEMVLDLKLFTREIKARILYNHLYHSDIENNAIQELLVGNTIQKIVNHRNYMPRIVQWMTDYFQIRATTPEEYPKTFLTTLDYPYKIWDKAFKKHISSNAQVLLFCMYVSKTKSYPTLGIEFDALKEFFDRAIKIFQIPQESNLRDDIFDQTLREIKSSFVVVESQKVNFINPSVQDFLLRAIEDKNVLIHLGKSATDFYVIEAIWNITQNGFQRNLVVRREISTSLLTALEAGEIKGRIGFDKGANLIGELMLISLNNNFSSFLRNGGIEKLAWTNPTKLPRLIGLLSNGKFSTLPYAQAYARLLRKQLSSSVLGENGYFDIEELAELADSFSDTDYQFSETLIDRFEVLATDEIENLDPRSLVEDTLLEFNIENWIENIESIENFLGTTDGDLKIYDLREFLNEREMIFENLEEQHLQEKKINKSTFGDKNLPSPNSAITAKFSKRERFSDQDLDTMFSSLKKPDS